MVIGSPFFQTSKVLKRTPHRYPLPCVFLNREPISVNGERLFFRIQNCRVYDQCRSLRRMLMLFFPPHAAPPTPASMPSATTAHGIVASGNFQGFAGDQCFTDNTAGSE